MHKNAYIDIDITGVNADGFGVGHAEGCALFVDGALPGDRVHARIVKIKPRYAYAKIERVMRPSPYRGTALCPVAARCGGCQWQHSHYDGQLIFKKRIVIDALERIGKIPNPPVADVLGMDNPYHYRNKAVFPVGPAENGFAIGTYAPRSHRIVPVSDCNIQHPAHTAILEAVSAYAQARGVAPYDEITHTGLLRQVLFRVSFHTGEVLAALVVNGRSLPKEKELAARLTEAGASTVLLNIHTAKGNAVLGETFRVLSGSGFIRERVGGLDFQLSPRSFFQVNPAQAQVLYDQAIALGGLTGAETVIDAHAGVGCVALLAARQARKVYGVDMARSAVADAEKNAELNGITNAEFIVGLAETAVPALLAENAADVIFLDPPRKGCDDTLLDAIIRAAIPKVVYISCDPATLSRDIKRLHEGGYALSSVQPVDMFPMTGKVECAALLIYR